MEANNKPIPWPAGAVAFAKRHYKHKGNTELAALLQKKFPKDIPYNNTNVNTKLRRMGCKRTWEQVMSIRGRNAKLGMYVRGKNSRDKRLHAPVGMLFWREVANCFYVKTETGFMTYMRWRALQLYGTIPRHLRVEAADGNNRNIADCNIILRPRLVQKSGKDWYTDNRVARSLAKDNKPMRQALQANKPLIQLTRNKLLLTRYLATAL